ncbi:MAG: hypothetical protein ABIY55_04620 [Kofleriaceae bacterium]
MTGNRKERDSLSLSDLDLEDLGLRLELAITRAVQPEASGPGVHRDDLAGHRAASAEPAWSSGRLAQDPDALVSP